MLPVNFQRAVADKATVPIYYESRISKLSLNAAELPRIDAELEEITESKELTKKEKLKTKWAALEALERGQFLIMFTPPPASLNSQPRTSDQSSPAMRLQPWWSP